MQARETALRRYFAQQACKACHHRGAPEAVIPIVRRARAWVVMVTCEKCSHRGLFVVSFPTQPRATQTTPSPITRSDVVAMRSFLDTFDGDFLSLFGKGHQGRLATE